MEEQKQKQSQAQTNYFGMGAEELASLVQAFIQNKDAARQVVEMFKPAISEIADLALDTIGPEAFKVVLRVALGNVEIRKAVFDKYIAVGFTTDQAFYMLTMDTAGAQGAAKFFDLATNSAMSAKNK
jgi:hypothetical protein